MDLADLAARLTSSVGSLLGSNTRTLDKNPTAARFCGSEGISSWVSVLIYIATSNRWSCHRRIIDFYIHMYVSPDPLTTVLRIWCAAQVNRKVARHTLLMYVSNLGIGRSPRANTILHGGTNVSKTSLAGAHRGRGALVPLEEHNAYAPLTGDGVLNRRFPIPSPLLLSLENTE